MSWRDRARALIKEPLVHFLIGGAAIFLLSWWRGEPVDPASRTITIEAATVENLVNNHARVWRRAPTRAELDGLIQDQIREEVYYREALRLGLDQDDPLVRRRMRAKMEAIAEASADSLQPSEAELQAFLRKNATRYATDAQLSFDQIFIGEGQGATELGKLAHGGDPNRLGTPISLPSQMVDQPASDIDAQFGTGFAARITALPLNQWTGPVSSGYGNHLVRKSRQSAGKIPELVDVRQRVEADWRSDVSRKRREDGFKLLLDSYTIKIAPLS